MHLGKFSPHNLFSTHRKGSNQCSPSKKVMSVRPLTTAHRVSLFYSILNICSQWTLMITILAVVIYMNCQLWITSGTKLWLVIESNIHMRDPQILHRFFVYLGNREKNIASKRVSSGFINEKWTSLIIWMYVTFPYFWIIS